MLRKVAMISQEKTCRGCLTPNVANWATSISRSFNDECNCYWGAGKIDVEKETEEKEDKEDEDNHKQTFVAKLAKAN
mgnify:CR=1 FL=1